MKKISILFGAGAEGEEYFGICNGNEFTLNTIFTKKEKLYDALKNQMYNDIKIDNYIDSYERIFLFNKGGKTFKNLIDTLIDNKFISKYSEINDVFNDIMQNGIDNSAYSLKKLYDLIIKENTYVDDIGDDTRKEICNYLTFMGTLESYFSSIINPMEYSKTRFWKLINYYWSAYFSILLPILDSSEKYKNDEDYKKNKYEYVLVHINDISKELFEDEFIEKFNHKQNYYSEAKKLINGEEKIEYIFTTNYTPFVYLTGISRDKICFLAGKLNQFEYPDGLYVKEIIKNEKLNNGDMAFPFIMTQVPIKPIIEPKQINEYANFIKYLNKTNILIIIGYNLNRNDNHINAILRDFILKKNKELIYCEYSKIKYNTNSKLAEIKEKLKIKNNDVNIKIIHNSGDAELLFDKIIQQKS